LLPNKKAGARQPHLCAAAPMASYL